MPRHIPVFIIAFNRLSWLKVLVRQVRRFEGLEPVIVDNGSVYTPRLE